MEIGACALFNNRKRCPWDFMKKIPFTNMKKVMEESY